MTGQADRGRGSGSTSGDI